MGRLASKLRIGEKIGFGFGLVGILFLAVIWQYHNILQQSIDDYQRLQTVFGAKKTHALAIENRMLEARKSEKDFLIQRDEVYANEVNRHVERSLQEAERLRAINEPSARTADRISALMQSYQQSFTAIAEAWRQKGLDRNSGLQGAFRERVQELESMAGNLKVGRLYLQLLQIRRGEKDLGLRREKQYRAHVLNLVDDFKQRVAESELRNALKTQLLQEADVYRNTFQDYARSVLANEDIHGGKGPFRQAAHRIESALNLHYVPDLERNILQLRRWEKDYLLTSDREYVDLVLKELERIRTQVQASKITNTDKSRFLGLMKNYQRDFLALAEQNSQIEQLTGEMRKAVAEVAVLVEENVINTNEMMNQITANIDRSSKENTRLMLWIIALGTLLGVFFAISITIRITGPLKKMAGLLDRLAYEEPTERMHFIPGGRDEVNEMAEAVNTMADNKARFIAWWKTSMLQADACQKLEARMAATNSSNATEALPDSENQLWQAIQAKRELLSEQYQEISRLNSVIVDKAEHLLAENLKGKTQTTINDIRHSANSVQNIVDMASFHPIPESERRIN